MIKIKKTTTPHNKVGFYSVNAKLVYHSKINVSYHIEQIKKKSVIISINTGKILKFKTHSLFKQKITDHRGKEDICNSYI